MAEVNGTSGNDFIHVQGDGLVPPEGQNDVIGATNGDDVIVPGGGVDIIYCGSGNDLIRIDYSSDISGLAEGIFGGDGLDVLQIVGLGSEFVDISKCQISSVEVLNLSNSAFLRVIISPDQFSEFRQIGASFSNQNEIVLSHSGSVEFQQSGAALSNISSIVGSIGNDIFNISAVAYNLLISGEGGDDQITFRYTLRVGNDPRSFTLDGGAGDDRLTGERGLFTLDGGKGDDKLAGGKLADTLKGGAGNDRLTGDRGQDSLGGGAGRDVFIFKSHEDSLPGSRDRILDFSQAETDRLDLSKIDADLLQDGNQAFQLGGAVFTSMAGELIQTLTAGGDTLLQGDVNGDGMADFELTLLGGPVLTASDFVL